MFLNTFTIEGIEVTFNQKRVNLNTVIDISKVQNGDSPPVYNEILFKRQIDNSEEEFLSYPDSDSELNFVCLEDNESGNDESD